MKTWNITQLVKIARNDTPWVRRHLEKAGIAPAKHIVINGKDWSQWGRDAFDYITAYRAAKDGKKAVVPTGATYNITTLRRVAGKNANTIRAALYAAGITEVEKHELTPTGKDYSRWGQDAYDFAYSSNKKNASRVSATPAEPVQKEMEFVIPEGALPPAEYTAPKGTLTLAVNAVEMQLQMLNEKFDRLLAVWEK